MECENSQVQLVLVRLDGQNRVYNSHIGEKMVNSGNTELWSCIDLRTRFQDLEDYRKLGQQFINGSNERQGDPDDAQEITAF